MIRPENPRVECVDSDAMRWMVIAGVSTFCGMTSWMDLATGARIAGCCIGFTELGGDGAADPALGATNILFR